MQKNAVWRISHYLLLFLVLIPVCLLISGLVCFLLALLGLGVIELATTTFGRTPWTDGRYYVLPFFGFCIYLSFLMFAYGWRAFARYVRADLQSAGQKNELYRRAQEAMQNLDNNNLR
jgi:cytochrome b subunit of formate dehydrogenase